MTELPLEPDARAGRQNPSSARAAELEAENAALRRELANARAEAGRLVARHGAALAQASENRAAEAAEARGAAAETEARHGREMAASRGDLAAAEERNAALASANPELAASRAALRHREELLRLVLDSATDYAIFATGLDRRVTSWNAGAERLMGWSEAEIVGRSADEIFTPEDRAAGAPEREAGGALRDGRAANERWHLRKDGSRFWGSGLVMPLRDPAAGPGAPPVGLVKVMRDRTERQRAEEALRARELRLRLLADTAAGLLAAPDPDGVLGPLFRSLEEGFGIDISFSYVADGESGGLRLSSSFGVPGEVLAAFARLALGEAVCGAAALARRAAYVPDVQASDDPAAAALRPLGVRAYAAFPLLARDKLLGTISFGSRVRAGFPDEDLAFFRAIAHHVAVVRERLRAEAALRESEERRRAALAAAQLGTFEWDLATGAVSLDARARELFGFAPGEGGREQEVFDRIHPEDLPRVRAEARAAVGALSRLETEYRVRPAGGGGAVRVVSSLSDALPGPGGGAGRMVGVFADVTERKRAEERRALLVNELNHRVKNTLAVVQSLAMQTARGAPDLAAFQESFEDRLVALARAHDLLTRESWEGAPLEDVARAALEPGGAGRVDFACGCVAGWMLPPAQALALAMALHELGTNALKHGALSAPAGRVSVGCRIEPETGAPVVEWVEKGGPPVAAAPARRGFGLRLLEQGLAAQAGVAVDLRFEPEGLRCALRLPAAS